MNGESPFGRLGTWMHANATTLRVAASYLVIIMVMSVGFSWLLYTTSARELGRQLPPEQVFVDPGAGFSDYRAFFRSRIAQGEAHLLGNLVLLNTGVMVAGAGFSYWLARRTLEPIERAMDAQARFASDASHELRTPLAALQAENEVALRSPKLSPERARELLASNLEEVVRLHALIENLLQLARGTKPDTMAPLATAVAIATAVRQLQPLADLKHMQVTVAASDLKARADSASLVQIITILLDNAIKYSPAHTTITVTNALENGTVRVQVHDEGAGIPAADMPHIFKRFYRADASRTKQHTDGTGLGLAIAAQLAEHLHGSIHIASTPGGGTTGTIILPGA